MTWAALAPFIVQYGIDAGFKLWELIQSGDREITAEDWASLRSVVNKSKADYLAESRERLGLPPEA